MATLAVTPPARGRAPAAGGAELPGLWDSAAPTPGAESLSLDDRISSLWQDLAGSAEVSCPVCSAAMAPRWSAGAGVVGGRCTGCGTTLE